MASLRVACAMGVLLALALSAAAPARAADAEDDAEDGAALDEEVTPSALGLGANLLRLTLPDFPSDPLTRHAAADDAEVDVDVSPRFSTADADEAADEQQSAETAQSEADAEAEAAAEASEQDAEAEAEMEAEDEPQPQPRFVQRTPQQMRFASAMARRYDSNALPPGALPVQPSHLQYDLAHLPVTAIGDALFQPLHHSERQFLNAQPVANMASNPNSYAWAGARLQPTYVYGNTLLGAPVNAQFYPPPSPGVAASAGAIPSPLVPSQAAIAAVAPSATPAALVPAAGSDEAAQASFLQTAAAAAQASRLMWPSSIPRPAAFYLPADLAI